MIVSLLKFSRKKEVIKRIELSKIAEMIRENPEKERVLNLRRNYQFYKPQRLPDGQITLYDQSHAVNLPRILFAVDSMNYKEIQKGLRYNGLAVVEVNGLKTYEDAVTIRNQAARMDETLMAFLGASGMSVKIVCRGELFQTPPLTPPLEGAGNSYGGTANRTAPLEKAGNMLPTKEEDIRQFHKNLYETARRAYQNQFGLDIEYLEPLLERTVYLSADPEMYFNPDARPFKADCEIHKEPEQAQISRESDMLMPGRTVKRTYHFNWLFILREVLGDYFDLPDEDRQMQLLQQIARKSLEQGIPLSHAQGMTLEHPLFHNDPDLVKSVFATTYEVTLMEDYRKTHRIKPLKSVPQETLQAMRTEIFLTANYDMRKNLMTGVAEYRMKYSEDQTFKPLTQEVRNDMTIEAREQGLKSWDQDVNRFIDSTRIEQYDPVNTWLDQLPAWDGHDYIADLAMRVPTEQPHWEKYLRYWLVGMVAQWRESDKQLTGNALTPLLIGRQGCGKTRFCKILLPEELRDYYNDKLNFKNEFDLNIALTSFALINIDEFDKTSNSQQIVLKYLLSSSNVKFRPPYGKTIKQYRRYTSFIGTTNQLQPLVDPTGSRRFVCVGIPNGKNIDFTDDLNHRQLYAQALYLFNNGERFWLENDEIQTLIEENAPYQRTVDLVEMINETFRKPKEGEGCWWRTAEILETFANRYAYFDAKRTTPVALGKAMNNFRFGFRHRMVNGCSEYWLCEK
ncbi:MAG: hypothetical protein K6F20_05400 [Bacteroidaceae bacterium]|nr:hypothetical protein [Bacteroidaceae bacterium]